MNVISTISVLFKCRVGEDWSDLGTELSLAVERFADY